MWLCSNVSQLKITPSDGHQLTPIKLKDKRSLCSEKVTHSSSAFSFNIRKPAGMHSGQTKQLVKLIKGALSLVECVSMMFDV